MVKIGQCFKKVTKSPLYKGVESVLSIWLTIAHSGGFHVISAKDFEIHYSFAVSTPVVYIAARFSAALFERDWVHWMVDLVFLIIYTMNYLLVFFFLISETKGMEKFHNTFFVEQRTRLLPGMVYVKGLVAFGLILLIVIDIVSLIVWRERSPKHLPGIPKTQKEMKIKPSKKKIGPSKKI